MKLPFFLAAGLLCQLASAAAPAPDLDLGIAYYSKVVTAEGVTRESRYEEKMLRRPGHVWTWRALPKGDAAQSDAHKGDVHEHKEFNYVLLARHVTMENNKLRLEFVDGHEREVIAIPATEYENVHFDGSWSNSFYLLDPQLVAAMPLSGQRSMVPGARWREVEKKGVFQRVLWDEQKQIALVMESGDRAGTFLRRVEVRPAAGLRRELPWLALKTYGQKEYSDFLD